MSLKTHTEPVFYLSSITLGIPFTTHRSVYDEKLYDRPNWCFGSSVSAYHFPSFIHPLPSSTCFLVCLLPKLNCCKNLWSHPFSWFISEHFSRLCKFTRKIPMNFLPVLSTYPIYALWRMLLLLFWRGIKFNSPSSYASASLAANNVQGE